MDKKAAAKYRARAKRASDGWLDNEAHTLVFERRYIAISDRDADEMLAILEAERLSRLAARFQS